MLLGCHLWTVLPLRHPKQHALWSPGLGSPALLSHPHVLLGLLREVSSSLSHGGWLYSQGSDTVGFRGTLHSHCKRNVKQQSDQSELYKGTLFSTIFLLVFRVAGEGFILLGAGCRGSVHTTSRGICQESWWLQPLTKSSFMTLGLVMGWMNTASRAVL